MNALLTNRLIDDLVTAAQHGWGPDDLLHLLGRDVHPLLYRAAPRIPARITSPALRHEWLMLAPPRDPFFSPDRIHAWLREVPLLPRLRDVPLLDNPTPSPEQAGMRRKIDALLRKAESTTFPAEAEALVARAQSLRQAHRIQDALGDAAVVARRVRLAAPYVKHKFVLLTAIAEANGVTGLLLHDCGIVALLGASEDLDHTVDLYESLSRQCAHFMAASPGAGAAKEAGRTASYRRSFQLSFAARIGQLLAGANATADSAYNCDLARHPAAPSFDDSPADAPALPVLARRAALAEQARDKLFPNLSTMRLSAQNYAGVRDGVTAAEASHLRGDSAGLDAHQRALTA